MVEVGGEVDIVHAQRLRQVVVDATVGWAGHAVEMQGAQGAIGGAFRAGPLSFDLGGLALADRAPLVMDLRPIS